MIKSFLETSIIKRAIDQKLVQIEVTNFRDFSIEKHKKVDDNIFGGGAGMLLMLDPIVRCLKNVRTQNSKVYLLSPDGTKLDQSLVYDLSKNIEHLILVAGHYEGFDHRIYNYVDGALSIGDYIMTGGELPAMVVCDSIVRLLPNVINSDSLLSESFDDYLLDKPSYTRPSIYDGYKVPQILLSGNHKEIKKFNNLEKIRITKEKRPDLYLKYLKFKKEKNHGK